MDEFTLLILECLVEVGRGQVTPFAQNFPQPLLLHGFTLAPGQLEEPGNAIKRKGVIALLQ